MPKSRPEEATTLPGSRLMQQVYSRLHRLEIASFDKNIKQASEIRKGNLRVRFCVRSPCSWQRDAMISSPPHVQSLEVKPFVLHELPYLADKDTAETIGLD